MDKNLNIWTQTDQFGARNTWQIEPADFNNDGQIEGVMVNNGGYYDLGQPDYFYWRNVKHPEGTYYYSPVINPTNLYPSNGNLLSWDELYIDYDEPLDSTLTITIAEEVGPFNWNIIATGLIVGPNNTVDLSFLDANLYPSIVLIANFQRGINNPSIGPSLDLWKVFFTMDGYTSPSFNFDVRVVTSDAIL